MLLNVGDVGNADPNFLLSSLSNFVSQQENSGFQALAVAFSSSFNKKDQSLGQLEINSTRRNFQQNLSLPEIRGTSRMNSLSVKAWCTSATHREASQASHNWTQTKLWGWPNPLPEITEHLNNQGSTLILDVKMEKKKLMNKSEIFKTNKKEKWKNVELWWVLKCTVSFYMCRKIRELRLLFWC